MNCKTTSSKEDPDPSAKVLIIKNSSAGFAAKRNFRAAATYIDL